MAITWPPPGYPYVDTPPGTPPIDYILADIANSIVVKIDTSGASPGPTGPPGVGFTIVAVGDPIPSGLPVGQVILRVSP